MRANQTPTLETCSGAPHGRGTRLDEPHPASRKRGGAAESTREPVGEARPRQAAVGVEAQSGPAGHSVPVTVSNQADHVHAKNVVQVGVVHGDLHVTADRVDRVETALNVSVTTTRSMALYRYEGVDALPDSEVHVFVEAFTAQAVLLRRLRPVFVRSVPEACRTPALLMEPRKFRVGLDRPAHHYDADVPGQALRLDRASADGGADFPFYVTASAPEYFDGPARPERREQPRRVAAGAGLVMPGPARHRHHRSR